MNRRWADRREWVRLAESLFVAARIEQPAFAGRCIALLMQRMHRPLWVGDGSDRCCVADNG